MKFNFKAQKQNGEVYESEREASDRFVLYRELKAEGVTPILVSEGGKIGKRFFNLNRLFPRGIGAERKILLVRNLGSMLRAGLALSRALSVLEKQAKSERLKEVISGVALSVEKGRSLHEAMQEFPEVFSSLVIAMVRAGEESGALPEALITAGAELEKAHLLKKKVRGAMIYPLIILTLMVLIGILMLVYVVPNLTNTFKDLKITLPVSTRFIIAISELFTGHLVLIMVAVLLIAGGFSWGLKKKTGKRIANFLVLRVPIIGSLVKETNSARTARTLSSLIFAGVPVVEAISITGEIVGNVYYKEVLKETEAVIQKGAPLSKVFAEHEDLYPSFFSEMTAVGEETGKLGEMLGNIANYYEEEVDRRTKDMSTVIEPFLMIIIGIGVGFFAVAMLSPTYSLVNAI